MQNRNQGYKSANNNKKARGFKSSGSGLIIIFSVILLVGVLVLLQAFPDLMQINTAVTVSGSDGEQLASGLSGLRINEVMPKNKTTIADDTGEYGDWVEIHNASDKPAVLTGVGLTDKINTMKFTFPNITLPAGGYLIVFASGYSGQGNDGTLHAGFKISASGDDVFLISDSGTVIDQITLPVLKEDQSYARSVQTGDWDITDTPTPGRANDDTTPRQDISVVALPENPSIVINEVVAKNITAIADEDGEYSDYIELKNRTDKTINLKGLCLSDDPSKPMKWRIQSDIGLPAGGYVVIFCSGKDLQPTENNLPHTNFKISSEREILLLSDASGNLMDRVVIDALPNDNAYAREGDGDNWVVMQSPTPGLPNNRSSIIQMDRKILAENNTGLYISEAMSRNTGYKVGDITPDWVSIVNRGNQAVDLQGYGLSDNVSRPRKWQFPSVVIQPGERLVVYCDKTQNSTGLHTNFGISGLGEVLVLALPDGSIIDRLAMPEMRPDYTYGRDNNFTGLYYFAGSTPEQHNDYGMLGFSQEPVFATRGGQYSDAVLVSIEMPVNSTVRYTTDCTEPTANSAVYTGPLTVSSNTVIRARAFEDGMVPSYSVSQTYLIGTEHTLPVVSLTTNPEYLWSDEQGMYIKGPNAYNDFPYGSRNKGANFWMDWEYEAFVEYYTDHGEQALAQGVGIKLNGQYSRTESQKAFSVYARAKYSGKSEFEYPIFSALEYDSYKAFVLRASGNDTKYSRMRDIVQTAAAQGTSVLYQEGFPVVLYLNGEYWGHYNLRERVNKNMIARHEGFTDVDNIDIIKGVSRVNNGSYDDYGALMDYVKSNDLRDDEKLQYVLDRVDVINYFDYQILEIYMGNTDLGNIKFYRSKADGSKWRWIFYDLDWGMWTSEKRNGFKMVLKEGGNGVGNSFPTDLILGLLKNTKMRDLFLTRLGYLYNNNLNSSLMLDRINWMYNQIESEMPRHFIKFPTDNMSPEKSLQNWKDHVSRLQKVIQDRPAIFMADCIDFFNLTDAEVEKYFSPDNDGTLELQGLTL